MNKKLVRLQVIILGLCLLVSGCVAKANDDTEPIHMAEIGSISSAYLVDNDVGWVITSSSVFKTDDGGQEWTNVTPDAFAEFSDVKAAFLNDSIGWIGLFKEDDPNLQVLRTIDGGKNWATCSIESREGAMAPWPVALTFTDSNHGWLVTSYGVAAGSNWVDVYITQDGGQLWQLAASGNPNKPEAGLPDSGLPLGGLKTGLGTADSQRAWLTGFSYGDGVWLYGTRDGGQTWYPIELAVDPTYNTEGGSAPSWPPVFVDSQSGFLPVTFSDNGCIVFYRTRNGGNTWEATVPVPASDYEPLWTFVDSEHGFVVDGSKLNVTADGCQSWQAIDFKLADVSQLHFISPEQGWAVSEGKLFSTADGGVTWVQVTQ